MGKTKAKSRWYKEGRRSSLARARQLVFVTALALFGAWSTTLQADISFNGTNSGKTLVLNNNSSSSIVSTGMWDNIMTGLNASSSGRLWTGILRIDGTDVIDRAAVPEEYTAQLAMQSPFYLGGLITVNSKSRLLIISNNGITTSPLTFNLANGGRMYLMGGNVIGTLNDSGEVIVRANWEGKSGGSLIFGFNNTASQSFNQQPLNNWTTNVNVATLTVKGEAVFKNNFGVVSSHTTPWQTANGTKYKAGLITVGGGMTVSGTDIARSSLFYRPELEVSNSSGYSPENTIHVYAEVSGFGGLNNNLRGLANQGCGVIYLSDNQLQVAANLDRARAAVADTDANPIASVIRPMWEYGDAWDLADDTGAFTRELGHAEQMERISALGHLFQQLSGDTHANAMYLGLYQPWLAPLAQLNLGAQMVFTGDPVKPVGQMNRLWITPMYTGTDLYADGNARGAGVTRTGVQLGADRRIAQNASVGLAAGYHSAYLFQENDRVQFCDLQLGVYGGAMVGNYFEVRSYLGLGLQSYDSTRIVDLARLRTGDPSQTAFGKADGCGIYFTTEISRPLFVGPIVVRPTLAVDSETAIRKEFAETGDDISLRVDRATFHRTRFRIGSSFETNPMRPQSRVTLTSRVFYAVQLDGRDYASVHSQFNSVFADPGQTAKSIRSGRNYLDVGGGIKSYINKARTLSGVLNYEGSFSEYTTNNGVSLGLAFLF